MRYIQQVATILLLTVTACFAQAAKKEKALDLRQLVYEKCASWAVLGDAKKEKVHGKPVVTIELLDTRSLFGKAKLHRARVMNASFAEFHGPAFSFKGVLVNDGKADILGSQEEILKAFHGAEPKEVDDVALLCRLFAELTGSSLPVRPPGDKKTQSLLPDDIKDQSKTDWSITIRKLNNQWRASFTVIDKQSYRVVRYSLLFGTHRITVTNKKVLHKGMTFI